MTNIIEEDVDEDDDEVGSNRRKKRKINVYEFFNEMRRLGVRPLDDEPS